MHIWIDIDKKEHIPFLKAIIYELKERGHNVTITCPKSKEIIKLLENNKINARTISRIISFFGILLEPSNYIRAVLLLDYIKNRNINIAFSLGSVSQLHTILQTDIPIVLPVSNYEKRPNNLYFAYSKCFFMVPEDIPEQSLIEKGYDLKKIARYKSPIENASLENDAKFVKEIVNQIELLHHRIPGSISA